MKEIELEESKKEVNEVDDGPDLNMMCSCITEVEPVSLKNVF